MAESKKLNKPACLVSVPVPMTLNRTQPQAKHRSIPGAFEQGARGHSCATIFRCPCQQSSRRQPRVCGSAVIQVRTGFKTENNLRKSRLPHHWQ